MPRRTIPSQTGTIGTLLAGTLRRGVLLAISMLVGSVLVIDAYANSATDPGNEFDLQPAVPGHSAGAPIAVSPVRVAISRPIMISHGVRFSARSEPEPAAAVAERKVLIGLLTLTFAAMLGMVGMLWRSVSQAATAGGRPSPDWLR